MISNVWLLGRVCLLASFHRSDMSAVL